MASKVVGLTDSSADFGVDLQADTPICARPRLLHCVARAVLGGRVPDYGVRARVMLMRSWSEDYWATSSRLMY
jgi:hypothetical protein